MPRGREILPRFGDFPDIQEPEDLCLPKRRPQPPLRQGAGEIYQGVGHGRVGNLGDLDAILSGE